MRWTEKKREGLSSYWWGGIGAEFVTRPTPDVQPEEVICFWIKIPVIGEVRVCIAMEP